MTKLQGKAEPAPVPRHRGFSIDALLAGRANRPEFAELLNFSKDAADTIERGDLFTAFRDEPEKNNRLCSLADALQKP